MKKRKSRQNRSRERERERELVRLDFGIWKRILLPSFPARSFFWGGESAGGGKYLEVCKYRRRPRREKPRIREEEVSYRKDTSFSCASRFVSSISRVVKSVKTFDQYIRKCVLTRRVKICGLIFVTPSPPSTSRSNNNFFFVLRQHVFGSSSEGGGKDHVTTNVFSKLSGQQQKKIQFTQKQEQTLFKDLRH